MPSVQLDDLVLVRIQLLCDVKDDSSLKDDVCYGVGSVCVVRNVLDTLTAVFNVRKREIEHKYVVDQRVYVHDHIYVLHNTVFQLDQTFGYVLEPESLVFCMN